MAPPLQNRGQSSDARGWQEVNLHGPGRNNEGGCETHDLGRYGELGDHVQEDERGREADSGERWGTLCVSAMLKGGGIATLTAVDDGDLVSVDFCCGHANDTREEGGVTEDEDVLGVLGLVDPVAVNRADKCGASGEDRKPHG